MESVKLRKLGSPAKARRRSTSEKELKKMAEKMAANRVRWPSIVDGRPLLHEEPEVISK